jgi:hypothetical protein
LNFLNNIPEVAMTKESNNNSDVGKFGYQPKNTEQRGYQPKPDGGHQPSNPPQSPKPPNTGTGVKKSDK